MSAIFKCECPHCGVKMEFTSEDAGRSCDCPSCGNTLQLPIPSANLINEAKSPALPPPEIVYAPPQTIYVKEKSKTGCLVKIVAAFLVFILIGFVISLLSTSENNPTPIKPAPTAQNEPMATPTYGLSPITVKLQNQLIDVMNRTDELDAMIKRGCTAEQYFAVGAPIEKSAIGLQDALPSKDIRIYLFVGTMQKYQTLGLGLQNNASSDELLVTDAAAAVSKVFLLKILNGTLDDSGKAMFNTVNEQIKSGNM